VHASKDFVPGKPELWLFTGALSMKEEEAVLVSEDEGLAEGVGNGERKGGDVETGVPRLRARFMNVVLPVPVRPNRLLTLYFSTRIGWKGRDVRDVVSLEERNK
jgi:hypothetical protein